MRRILLALCTGEISSPSSITLVNATESGPTDAVVKLYATPNFTHKAGKFGAGQSPRWQTRNYAEGSGAQPAPLLFSIGAGLAVPEAGVVAALGHELGMGAVLGDPAVGEHHDAVEARHR